MTHEVERDFKYMEVRHYWSNIMTNPIKGVSHEVRSSNEVV